MMFSLRLDTERSVALHDACHGWHPGKLSVMRPLAPGQKSSSVKDAAKCAKRLFCRPNVSQETMIPCAAGAA
jgi:hypothetical protein